MAVGDLTGVGVFVTVRNLVGMGVLGGRNVSVGVFVGVNVIVGPKTWPDAQPSNTKLKRKTRSVVIRFLAFISHPIYHCDYPTSRTRHYARFHALF